MSPTDEHAYYGAPNLYTPRYDEVHVSVVFGWDKRKAFQVARAWRGYGKVRFGGPAFGDPGQEFVPGRYVAAGVTFTSRGCPKRCGPCFVARREGALREMQVAPGHIVQDNNFLACSRQHRERVYAMLRTQRGIEFRGGGVDASLMTPQIAHEFAALRVKSIFLACDTPGGIGPLSWALYLLGVVGFTRRKLYCYVIVGKDMAEEEARLRRIYQMGAIPFAQLLQPYETRRIEYPKKWQDFVRRWSRPAIIKNRMKKITEAK